MNDILPGATATWSHLEAIVKDVVESYGYKEIRLPILEQTELFARSIGETTDVVEKEMYTFKDRDGDSITMRPEATAGMVRAGISNGLLHNQRQKLWTAGPMFRHEKPQKGRYRQFHQVDVEALGYAGPDVDAELILLCARMWQRMGIDRLKLEINSLGTPDTRATYREVLVQYFSGVKKQLDEDSIRRLDKNPLRILDSKNPDMRALVEAAPVMLDYLDDESAAHFSDLKSMLDENGVAYSVNPRLVRGLDYYNRTVFEWATDALGSQGAVCSGGRYDGLVEKLGGRTTPAIGWAMGVERLVMLYEVCGGIAPAATPDVYIVAVGDAALRRCLKLAEQIREGIAGAIVELNLDGGSFKSQLKRADKSGANVALIMGDDEVAANEIGMKPLRSKDDQTSIALDDLVTTLAGKLKKKAE
jgi:histidyl-tRNA synthetase